MSEPMAVSVLLEKVREYVGLRVSEIDEYQQTRPENLTVETLDDLIADVLELKSIVSALGDISKDVNKSVMRHESRAGKYLEALAREDYESPDGSIERKRDWHVNMPDTDEAKLELFEWLKEGGIFEKYATVNSRSLQSLFMAEWEAAKKKDPDAGVLFSLPGVPAPTINEYTQIKAPKGQRAKRKAKDNVELER